MHLRVNSQCHDDATLKAVLPLPERSKMRSRPLGQTARIYISTYRTRIARTTAFLFTVGVALVFLERFIRGPQHVDVVEIDLVGLEIHVQPARASPRPLRAGNVAAAPRERPPAPNGVQAWRTRPKEFSCGEAASASKIAWERVEDGYCDCPVSGADEVHSGACSGAGKTAHADFECASHPGVPTMRIFASRVNDGVCDCCDGSDEFASGAACADNCGAARAALEADALARAAGTKARTALLAAAQRSGAAHNEAVYGTGGAFAALEGKCWSHDAGEYRYKLCPYARVEQQRLDAKRQRVTGAPTLLGSSFKWKVRDVSGMMSSGTTCPSGTQRTTRIEFICAARTDLLSVSEHETCVYLARLATPAACVAHRAALSR